MQEQGFILSANEFSAPVRPQPARALVHENCHKLRWKLPNRQPISAWVLVLSSGVAKELISTVVANVELLTHPNCNRVEAGRIKPL